MNCQTSIETVFETVRNEGDQGSPASYIPELVSTNPDNFGVSISTTDNRQFKCGNATERFSIQSIAKVLSLSMAYKMLGGKIWERTGVEPSGSAFNSLVQLETDNGIPRNPFINAGALVICDILISLLNNPMDDFIAFVRDIADNTQLNYSSKIAESEKSVGYRNAALCYFIKSYGNIENDPQDVLEFYFNLCSIEMSCVELSQTFLYLANQGRKTTDNKDILTMSQAKRINAIMQTCGLYDESGEFAYEVGLPGKSGVGGGIMAIYPNNYCIAVWSPRLNAKGNSYRGMKFLERFTTKTGSSIF
jgi:glutaminase